MALEESELERSDRYLMTRIELRILMLQKAIAAIAKDFEAKDWWNIEHLVEECMVGLKCVKELALLLQTIPLVQTGPGEVDSCENAGKTIG